ncbi:MAG: alpha/beta fold hydrolase [Nocardioidaceae bacterium]
MRPWAEHLAAAGFTVSLPRLPGHGSTWQDLNRTRWQDWYAEVCRALDELMATCDEVMVAGLSMGGCLALRLAEKRPAEVAGLDSGQSLDRQPGPKTARRAGPQTCSWIGQRHRQRHQEARCRGVGLRLHTAESARLVALVVAGDPR